MSGTIKFDADQTGGDSKKIRLFQALRDFDLDTGPTSGPAGMRGAIRSVLPPCRKRASRRAGGSTSIRRWPPRAPRRPIPACRPTTGPIGQRGKQPGRLQDGHQVVPASLWDYPGSSGNRRFDFETVAKARVTGEIYGTVLWGFTISDAAKGTVEKEYSSGRGGMTATTAKALRVFNEYYANPGSPTAPQSSNGRRRTARDRSA